MKIDLKKVLEAIAPYKAEMESPSKEQRKELRSLGHSFFDDGQRIRCRWCSAAFFSRDGEICVEASKSASVSFGLSLMGVRFAVDMSCADLQLAMAGHAVEPNPNSETLRCLNCGERWGRDLLATATLAHKPLGLMRTCLETCLESKLYQNPKSAADGDKAPLRHHPQLECDENCRPTGKQVFGLSPVGAESEIQQNCQHLVRCKGDFADCVWCQLRFARKQVIFDVVDAWEAG